MSNAPWVFTAVIVAVLFFTLVPFTIHISKRWKRILNTHSTISSFCADPTSERYVNIFISSCSGLLAVSLAALLVEVKDSREDIRFWIALSAVLSLPLVGICPTSGSLTGPLARKHWFVVGNVAVPMVIPTIIHSVAAMYFMIANASLNLLYAVSFYRIGVVPLTQVLLAMAIISSIFLVFLLGTQCVMFLRLRIAWFQPPIPEFLLPKKLYPLKQEGQDMPPQALEFHRTTVFLHALSFVSELGTLTSVVLTTAAIATVERYLLFSLAQLDKLP